MTDLPTTPVSTPATAERPQRAPYQTPHIQPLGQWSALTLVISVPIGPGSAVFKDWNKP